MVRDSRPIEDVRWPGAEWKRPVIRHLKPTKWGWVVAYPEHLFLGKNSDVGYGTFIQAQYGVTIGEWAQIGAGCCIYSVSTIDGTRGPVLIRNNAKLGANSVVMPGVVIGRNSVVGALSFVNKSIPDDVVAWGIPAKVRRIPEADRIARELKLRPVELVDSGRTYGGKTIFRVKYKSAKVRRKP